MPPQHTHLLLVHRKYCKYTSTSDLGTTTSPIATHDPVLTTVL